MLVTLHLERTISQNIPPLLSTIISCNQCCHHLWWLKLNQSMKGATKKRNDISSNFFRECHPGLLYWFGKIVVSFAKASTKNMGGSCGRQEDPIFVSDDRTLDPLNSLAKNNASTFTLPTYTRNWLRPLPNPTNNRAILQHKGSLKSLANGLDGHCTSWD